MPVKRDCNPDSNLNDLDYSITYKICQNFDIDRTWELLAGVIGYSTSNIQTFELETQRANGSPTKKLLWDWGSRGGTVRNLYDKLDLINKAQSMRLLEHIVNPGKGKEKERKVENTVSVDDSIASKSDNCCTSDLDQNFYETEMLPIPSMKKCGPVVKEINMPDVNFNTPCMKNEKTGNKSPMFDKILSTMLEPHGASSGEMYAQADGPASMKGNLGAASSAARSFERVRSMMEYSSEGMNMSDWSEGNRQMAHALMSTPNYTYKDLSAATDGFKVHNRLGEGKFGEVFYGVVKNTKCAIKKLKQKRENPQDESSAACMAAELTTLSRYRHENIISLYGYTLDNDEVCLVYQYMTNGSLYQCLHNKPREVLSWERRLSILKGASCGLQFLHTADKTPVIHGNIKSGNILLDNHFVAKISDLGMAKQATGGDTAGRLTHITKKNTSINDYRNNVYHAPEIGRGNSFSIKGDSYSFGVVMFECLSGQEAYDERREGSVEHKYLFEYIQSAVEDSPKLNKQKTFQDPKLKISFPTTTFEMLFEVAQRCTHEKKKDRPNMVEVYAEIEKCENDHIGPEYQNIQEVVSEVDKAGSIHENHMSTKNQPSFSSDLKAPPGGNLNKNVPQSPIDMLPKGEPLPEAFALQVKSDQKQEKAPKAQDYINVNQTPDQMSTVFTSDPSKLEKLEKFDQKNVSQPENKANPMLNQFRRSPKPLENSEEICKKSPINNEVIYDFAVPIKGENQPENQNIPVTNADIGQAGSETPKDNSKCPGYEIDFSKEFDEIAFKAVKGDSSMNGIFDKFHTLAQGEALINVPDADYVDDNDEFDFKFDFEADDSESSTITESINNDLDLCSADFNDDALFVSEGPVHYANLPEKLSNENIDANLVEHQKKLSMYQGLTREDSEELHERSAQQEEVDLEKKPSQCHSKNIYENEIGVNNLKINDESHYENCSSVDRGQGYCDSQHATGNRNNMAGTHDNGNRRSSSSSDKVVNIQNFLHRREPSEGHCEEYV